MIAADAVKPTQSELSDSQSVLFYFILFSKIMYKQLCKT